MDHQKQVSSFHGQSKLRGFLTGNFGPFSSERMSMPRPSEPAGAGSNQKGLDLSNFSYYIERGSVKQKRVTTRSLKRRKFSEFNRFLAESPAFDGEKILKSRKGHRTLQNSPECNFRRSLKSPLVSKKSSKIDLRVDLEVF